MKKSLLIPAFLLFILSVVQGTAIRVSLSPILGSAPVLYAESWGLFTEEGVEVEIIPLASRMDRNLAFLAGQVDAVVTDVASLCLLGSRGSPVAVATAYSPEDPRSQFVVLVNPRYVEVDTVRDLLPLLGKRSFFRVALPLQSDLEFAMDMVLKGNGYEPDQAVYFGQDNLIYTAAMVAAGSVVAAVLPEPYASFILEFSGAQGLGLKALGDFEGIPPLPHLIVFQRGFMEAKPEAVEAFLRGFSRAAERINREGKEGLLALGAPEVIRLFYPGFEPEEVLSNPYVQAGIGGIRVPHFPEPGKLDPGVFEAVATWAVEKGYIAWKPAYEQVTVWAGTDDRG